MKIFTKILTAILCGTMLFITVGFTACTNGDLEAKIAELQAQITELQAQITELQEQNEELQASVEEQQTQIADLEQENQELEEQIGQLKDLQNGNKDSWEGVDTQWNTWYQQVEVDVEVPDSVVQGESFTIKVITTNVSNSIVEYTSGSCCQNLGVIISHIQGNNTAFMLSIPHTEHNEDVATTVIQVGESVEYEITIKTKNDTYDYLVPVGTYDVYLYNGDMYKNAINVISETII